MKKLLILLVAAAMLSSGAAYGNILNDLVGTWKVTSTVTQNGQSTTFTSTNVVRDLGNGFYHSVGTEVVGGRRVTTSEEWILGGGKSLCVGYDHLGAAELLGKGTWRVSGNVFSGTYIFQTLNGKLNWTGSITRINRARWQGTVTVKQGTATVLTSRNVYTRIR